MPLFVPGGGPQTVQSNISGQPFTTIGDSVTPVVGSKGAYREHIASTSADSYGIYIQMHNGTTSGSNRGYAVDIAIGAAGSEVVIIPDLIASNAPVYGTVTNGIWYYFPVFIPAGSRVASRAQGSVTTTFRVCVTLMQNPSNPALMPTASYVEQLGLSGITGTLVTPGTTSEGTWTLIGTTVRDLWWWQLGVQVPVADVSWVSVIHHYDIATGNGTNFRILAQDIPWVFTSSEQAGNIPQTVGCEGFVAGGSNIYVRSQTSAAGDTYAVAVYGAGG